MRASRLDDPQSDDEDEPDDDDADAIAWWKAKAKRYNSQRDLARKQRDRAETHCIMARGHIRGLQRQLNTKTSRTKRRNIRVPTGLISTEEGR